MSAPGSAADAPFAAALAKGSSSYAAPLWLPGGHLQTLYAALLAPRRHIRYRRERWETPDSDFIDLDWLQPVAWGDPSGASGAASRPLVVLFHGLEGGSASHYAHAVMSQVASEGWRGVVVHFRGCSGTPNRLPRAYHSGDSVELDWILRRLRTLSESPLYVMGISLGGNVLLKWLGEQGGAAKEIAAATAAVSAPVDLMAAGDALGRGFNLVYTTAVLRTLKHKSIAKLELHPGLYDGAAVQRARTLRAFDDVVTAPLHGFTNTDDYWTRASSKPGLVRISVPTLMINARNDPFLPAAALPSAPEVSRWVTRDFPEQGGHVGFVSGRFPGDITWLPRRVITFMRASTLLNAAAAGHSHQRTVT
jgi:predicted alpha/beta-fold hydrolase